MVTATTELVESVSLYLVSTDRLRLFNTTMRYPAGLPAVLVTVYYGDSGTAKLLILTWSR